MVHLTELMAGDFTAADEPSLFAAWFAEAARTETVNPTPRARRASRALVQSQCEEEPQRLSCSTPRRPGASPPISPSCLNYCVNRELLPASPKPKAQRAQPVALQEASSAKLLWAARPSSFLTHRPTSGSVQGTRGRARYSRSPPSLISFPKASLIALFLRAWDGTPLPAPRSARRLTSASSSAMLMGRRSLTSISRAS